MDESTNKNLICIIKKTFFSKQKNWHNVLVNALWDDRVTPKHSMKTSTHFLLYRKDVILSLNIYLLALQLSQESQGKPCLLVQSQINTLLNLEDERLKEK